MEIRLIRNSEIQLHFHNLRNMINQLKKKQAFNCLIVFEKNVKNLLNHIKENPQSIFYPLYVKNCML